MNPAIRLWGDDVYGYAQFVLDHHAEARDLIDDARRRRALIPETIELDRPFAELVDKWSKRSRKVLYYAAAIRKAARSLGPELEEAIHELVGRTGYTLRRPPLSQVTPNAPRPQVASAVAAVLTEEETFGSGATANRQARHRYVTHPTFQL